MARKGITSKSKVYVKFDAEAAKDACYERIEKERAEQRAQVKITRAPGEYTKIGDRDPNTLVHKAKTIIRFVDSAKLINRANELGEPKPIVASSGRTYR